MAACTRATVVGETFSGELSTLETVLAETSAWRATSWMVVT